MDAERPAQLDPQLFGDVRCDRGHQAQDDVYGIAERSRADLPLAHGGLQVVA